MAMITSQTLICFCISRKRAIKHFIICYFYFDFSHTSFGILIRHGIYEIKNSFYKRCVQENAQLHISKQAVTIFKISRQVPGGLVTYLILYFCGTPSIFMVLLIKQALDILVVFMQHVILCVIHNDVMKKISHITNLALLNMLCYVHTETLVSYQRN